MKISFLIIINIFLAIAFVNAKEEKLVRFAKSFGHKEHGLKKLSNLNPQLSLTLTIVTGSWANTKLVNTYFSSFGFFKVFEQTDMNLKLKGSVSKFSHVFNTTFVNYKCNSTSNLTCYATTNMVSIPSSLQTAIMGILGLEQVLTMEPKVRIANGRNFKRATTYTNFLPPQVAQVYGFPKSDGAGIRVGIVSLGGYFNQTDLQNYFDQFDLGEAPTINIVLINGFKYNDIWNAVLENYLDVEILASIVPKANITLYIAPNNFQGFYDVINIALKQSDVVSCSWGTLESVSSSYWTSFQAMFARYSNVPIFIATGDQGSKGGVAFPASCPNAIGCGGTTLNYNGKSITNITNYVSEVGWSGSNGGLSKAFVQPLYQKGLNTNGSRGVPDLAANANPYSGYKICFANKCPQTAGKKF